MEPTERIEGNRLESLSRQDARSSAAAQEDRILAALGIASGPLPQVHAEWLVRYYHFLSSRLSLPFDAEYAEDRPGQLPNVSLVTVIALLPPSDDAVEVDGLYCRIDRAGRQIEAPLIDVELPLQDSTSQESSVNNELIEDYWYWIWNWRFDPQI